VIVWSLTAFSVLWGLLALLVFRRFTNRAALRKVRKLIYAHLLEIRLYSDEPALVWNAQKALLLDNLRFLALTALPILIMAVPFALLYSPLDSIFGWGPIEVGHSAVVTLYTTRHMSFTLRPPPGIVVETPPVRAFAEHQISWRIRALMPVQGSLRFASPGMHDVSRSIFAGGRKLSFNRRRESLPGDAWTEVDYPRANVRIAGLELPWLAWFLIVSTATAALFTIW
jgi:hypothetical protein